MKIVEDEMGGIKVGCFGEKSKEKVGGRRSAVGSRQSSVVLPWSIFTFEKWYCCCEMRNAFSLQTV
jgi:hypothetical protein